MSDTVPDGLVQDLELALEHAQAERDALKALNTELVNALASISLSENDNTAPAHVVLKGMAKRARAALALARGTP